MTQTITIREGRANVFVAVEHANSEVIGIHASRSANRFEALEPVRRGVHRCFGAIAPSVAWQPNPGHLAMRKICSENRDHYTQQTSCVRALIVDLVAGPGVRGGPQRVDAIEKTRFLRSVCGPLSSLAAVRPLLQP